MEYNLNEISTSENEIEITLKYDEIKSDIDEEIKKQSKKIQVPGFRKGKVPPAMVKKLYGDALAYEASEKVANTRFWKIAETKELNPIGQPVMTDLDFKPGNDLKFKVKYEIMPKLDIKNYVNQSIEVPDLIVRDEEVEKEIEHIKNSNSTTEDADIIGDDLQYKIDVELFRLNENNEQDEKSKSEKLQIDLTNERVQPDIKENAKGKKTGDSFNFTFDDERTVKNKDGIDEKIVEKLNYKVLILSIKKIVPPELNEELVKKVTKGKASNEEELKQQIKDDIQKYYDQRTDEFIRTKLISMIIKNNDFIPPTSFVSNLLEEMIKSEEERLKKQGIKKIDKDEIRNYFKPGAENEVKWYLLRAAIQKKENIEITDKDLEEMAAMESEKTGLPVDKLMNYYKNSNQHEKLIDKKLFDFLKGNNKIKKVDPAKFTKPEKEEKNV